MCEVWQSSRLMIYVTLFYSIVMADWLAYWWSDWSFSLMCVCVCIYSVRPAETSVSMPTFFPLDSLQKKLKDLEEENKSLRFEVHTHAQTLTCT